ncbi:SDR family oxidoreductase [Asticcacaulis sp.]|uniref:SDR family oxidoreductase n=1 Tax=Asticcacaulis sp. TaxID=1872648 RepID=UPI0039C894F1
MITEDPTRIPSRKYVVPHQIGDVAAFLVPEKASGINGQAIHVANGFTAVE